MSSPPSPSGSQQAQPPPRKAAVLFPGLPSIKIITPPKGRFSPATDERCITYCSQSVSGRIHKQEPWCRSLCLRKVFAHEVRNIVTYERHRKVDADGKAKYKLPPEGRDLPVYLGGKSAADGKDSDEANYWHEGWYVWFSKSPYAATHKAHHMRYGVAYDESREAHRVALQKKWSSYEARTMAEAVAKAKALEEGTPAPAPPLPNNWKYAPPPPPLPDLAPNSLLVPLPVPFPLIPMLDRLLAPTRRSVELLQENIQSGHLAGFLGRVYDKAFTEEPLILAHRTWKWTHDQFKAGPPSDPDDDKKGSA